jgi:CheY-like chemotaxis protein
MQSQEFPSDARKIHFVQVLRKALKSLYNPTVLMGSVLLDWLEIEKKSDAVAVLRRTLTESIERLKPADGEPQELKSWRLYHVLHQRYTMQWPPYRVAANIGVGDRQLLREEKAAVELLAETFWREYQLDQKIPTHNDSANPVRDVQSLESSTSDIPVNPFDGVSSLIQPELILLNGLVRDVLKTLKPVGIRAGVEIKIQLGEDQRLFIRGPVLRQALLLIFNQAIAKAPQGQVLIQMESTDEQAGLSIIAISPQTTGGFINEAWRASEDAQRLIHLCDGIFHFIPFGCPADLAPCPDRTMFAARLLLPVLRRAAVLFVDDHADTLQLYKYYLDESRYRFISASSARQGLTIAKNELPQLVVLDVMMPQHDGWSLMEQLRVHPKTQHIPVLICSIVPQEDLAQALGAAEFLQKPVSRESLLAALDRHSNWQKTGSG